MPKQDVHAEILTCIKDLVDAAESWGAVVSNSAQYSRKELAHEERDKNDARKDLERAIEAMRVDTIRAVEKRERAAKSSKLREATELAFALALKIKDMN